MRIEEQRNTIQSIERAFAVLNTFSPNRPMLTISEIASAVKLNRTTVHRIVATLEKCGAVRRDPFSQRYMMSAGVLRFANVFNQVSDIRSTAHTPMVALRDEVGQTCALHIREGYSRITIAQVESSEDLRVTYPDIGQPFPLHLGAPGKAILAFLPDAEREQVLGQSTLAAATPYSVTDPSELRQQLEVIREQGYVVTEQERRPGVISIAAPVFDQSGNAAASVNVSGSVHRVDAEQATQLVPHVVHTAQEISRRLGYSG